MENIEIKDFIIAQTLNDTDFVVLSLADGSSAKVKARLMKEAMTRHITPSIQDGVWWIGDASQGIVAEGRTPEFRKGELGIEYKYSDEEDTAWKLLVPFSEISLDFDSLTDEQRELISLNYEDLTEEEIAELQKPALDMVAILTETNNSLTSAEAKRVQAERTRVQSENTRVANENARISAESDRANAESIRVSAESARVESESERSSSESERVAAENIRLQAETARKSAEIQRVENENVRQSNEQARAENEQTRVTNETARVSAENARSNAEAQRMDEEANRVLAEEGRASEYASLKEDVTEATDNANQAASAARNTPKIQDGTWWLYDSESGSYVDSGNAATGKSPIIQNGTWWVWNDETNAYGDTGQSVSSDYVLTKEKIESIFTGDITTHTHSNLDYAAQVYETEPDFDTLTSWSDESGVHDFRLGNDIYVANETEPTGYANYRFAKTAEGNAWVRIPQVTEGWRIVMVKQ